MLEFLFSLDLLLLLDELLLVLEGGAFVGVLTFLLVSQGPEESVVEGFLVDYHPSFVLLPMLFHGVLFGLLLETGDIASSLDIVGAVRLGFN